jgi:hypothetical protein
VVVAGALAQRPSRGGHAWVFLQYLLGFRRLGFDVLFLDRLEPDTCVDAEGRPVGVDASAGLAYLRSVMAGAGLDDAWSLLFDGGRQTRGRSRDDVLAHVRRSTLLLDVMGYLGDPELLDAAPRTAFLDIDPGFGQMWQAQGLAEMFGSHDAYVTVGANVGRPGCAVPSLGLSWVPVRPPVVLSQWPERPLPPGRPRVTSVGSWRGPFGPVEHEGRTYGLRVHELRALFDLPRRVDADVELALDISAAEEPDLERFDTGGWELVDPLTVAGTPEEYAAYVRGSSMELLVAKGMYVHTRSGWFSDRSACYLASGRPVVAHDTGLGDDLPLGAGLLAWSTPDDAEDAVRRVLADLPGHARAARAVAEEVFDSDRVLPALLDRLGGV